MHTCHARPCNLLLTCAGLASLFAVAGLPFSALGAMATLGSYYYLQPLGDTLALSMGIEYTPLVTVGNMALIVMANPVYAAAARNLPSSQILPVMYRVVSGVLLLFALLFYLLPGVKFLSFLSMPIILGSRVTSLYLVRLSVMCECRAVISTSSTSPSPSSNSVWLP